MFNKSQQGYVLISVLIVLILLAVIGGAYVFAARTELMQSNRHYNEAQAYYLARSGIEMGIEYIRDQPGSLLSNYLNNFNEKVCFDYTSAGLLMENKDCTMENGVSIQISTVDKSLLIKAIGFYRGVNREINVSIFPKSSQVPPGLEIDLREDWQDYYLDAIDELRWANQGGNIFNGDFNVDDYYDGTERNSIIFDRNPNGIKSASKGLTVISAAEIFIDNSLEIQPNAHLILESNLIIIEGYVSLQNISSKFCFRPRDTTKPAYIVFKDDVYVHNEADKRLIITEPLIFPFDDSICLWTDSNKLTFSGGDIIWR